MDDIDSMRVREVARAQGGDVCGCWWCVCVCFFFQAEDGIRGGSPSRGLGDVYKGQVVL